MRRIRKTVIYYRTGFWHSWWGYGVKWFLFWFVLAIIILSLPSYFNH